MKLLLNTVKALNGCCNGLNEQWKCTVSHAVISIFGCTTPNCIFNFILLERNNGTGWQKSEGRGLQIGQDPPLRLNTNNRNFLNRISRASRNAVQEIPARVLAVHPPIPQHQQPEMPRFKYLRKPVNRSVYLLYIFEINTYEYDRKLLEYLIRRWTFEKTHAIRAESNVFPALVISLITASMAAKQPRPTCFTFLFSLQIIQKSDKSLSE